MADNVKLLNLDKRRFKGTASVSVNRATNSFSGSIEAINSACRALAHHLPNGFRAVYDGSLVKEERHSDDVTISFGFDIINPNE